jgi:hypothetical protein
VTEETTNTFVGTVDVPAKIDRERYFRELTYLELPALFAGPLKASSLSKWEEAPAGSIGLVAPFPLTHRKPPPGSKLWPTDAKTGEFRITDAARATIEPLREAVTKTRARCVVFRSPDSFSPSAANRDALRAFFSELVPAELFGAVTTEDDVTMAVERVWVPGGLWEVRSAAKFASELGATLAFDPLVREPGEPAEVHYGLELRSLYLRPEGAGRAGMIRNERLEDLVALMEHYETLQVTVAFASPERWQDARNLMKMLRGDD